MCQIFFLAPFPLFVSVQTSMYGLNAILKGLKHATLKGWNAWLMCDGKVIKSNPTSIVTCELWPSKTSKCRFVVHIFP